MISFTLALTVAGLVMYVSGEPPASSTTVVHTVDDYLHPTQQSLDRIANHWNDNSATMLLESSRFVQAANVRSRLLALIEVKTKQSFGTDQHDWFHWMWKQPFQPSDDYRDFKRRLYSRVDIRFAEYFTDTKSATIRLDEILWGGVRRDGIPPLKNPKMLQAKKADYLGENDVVFGIEINGDARCYPKRILAWHEMFKDTIGGVSVCGVY